MPSFQRHLSDLLSLEFKERRTLLNGMSAAERREFRWHWQVWARPDQLAPEGEWSCWLISAGRGFGKTRAGAEWVRQQARHNPAARIALVAASLIEARGIMVEGESGIIACSPPHRRPTYEPSLRKLQWANGAQAFLYSAAEPESLRGPQHSHAWCDEIAKWDNAGERATRSWDNLAMGMRLDDGPRIVATTTPRAVPLMRRLMAQASGDGPDGAVRVTHGATLANYAALPPRFLAEMNRHYGGTQLGRQELDGVMIDDVEGALWTRDLIERGRITGVPDAIARIVIGVDPPASATGDACGIVVAGATVDDKACVLADCSVAKASPERWARAVADAAELWDADRVVAEANQGGAMVASVLRAASIDLPVKLVHASRGKAARAEPVAALYEAGRAAHAGTFPALEDEMCGLLAGGAYHGPGHSPDRADALVWALTELMLGRGAVPRIRSM